MASKDLFRLALVAVMAAPLMLTACGDEGDDTGAEDTGTEETEDTGTAE